METQSLIWSKGVEPLIFIVLPFSLSSTMLVLVARGKAACVQGDQLPPSLLLRKSHMCAPKGVKKQETQILPKLHAEISIYPICNATGVHMPAG